MCVCLCVCVCLFFFVYSEATDGIVCLYVCVCECCSEGGEKMVIHRSPPPSVGLYHPFHRQQPACHLIVVPGRQAVVGGRQRERVGFGRFRSFVCRSVWSFIHLRPIIHPSKAVCGRGRSIILPYALCVCVCMFVFSTAAPGLPRPGKLAATY